MGRIRANANLFRRAGNTMRSQTARAERGHKGAFEIHLATDGLPAARREELVAEMNRLAGTTPSEPVGDGLMHQRATIHGVPAGTAALWAVSEMASMLQRAGLQPGELDECSLWLELNPVEAEVAPEPKGLRARIARRAGLLSIGAAAAAAEAFDLGHRQANGDRDYEVALTAAGLTSEACEQARARGVAEGLVGEDQLQMLVTTSEVGSPFGALTLSLRKLSELLNDLNPEATLRTVVVADFEAQLRST